MGKELKSHNFLRLDTLSRDQFLGILDRAAVLKKERAQGILHDSLQRRILGMVFEKASTRTRVSFEAGMFELGGHAVYLSKEGSQMGRGEPIGDTARVLSSYCSALVFRTSGQERLDEFARYASVPVINGLTNKFHPCQIVADLQTVLEEHSSLTGLRFCWIGDGNNMAHSWINAASVLGLDLVLACPNGYQPDADIVSAARKRIEKDGRGKITITTDPREAAEQADVLSTDVWSSMGQEKEKEERAEAFAGFCIDLSLLAFAKQQAMVLHCLPAHRGEEITEDVLEGEQSKVFVQAGNRLHAHKAILESCLGDIS